ncbi:MAG TPA: glutamine synthetase family protein [Spirochaetota bacterium]|nr:glutamine synthetase family protein [Spirochaetota bacterium]
MNDDKDYILKLAHDNKIRFIRLWFTDILGFLKSFAITIDELEDALNEGVRFDGSTLQGYIRSDEEEMIALPDVSTFQVLPWRPKEDSVARMFCDIYNIDMTPYENDSRYILKKTLKKATSMGLTYYTGPEIEFFFFKNSENPLTLDHGRYFDNTPLDAASDFRRQTVLTLEKMGINVISSHHEGANSQHEIDLRHEDALTTADNIMTFKVVAKEIGQMNNIYASFMPKPLAGQNGSGLHVHQSLFRDDENIFFDASNEYHLSENGRYFIAGLLKHAEEFIPVTNQWINSYKRFTSGYEAPTKISWSTRSQSALIRIPNSRPDKPASMRIELRNPDPACNPYLAFSVMLAAGLKGIENRYELPENIDKLIQQDRLDEVKSIPMHMHDALNQFRNSDLMKETLGTVLFEKFLQNKMFEDEEFNRFITDFEIQKYLPVL